MGLALGNHQGSCGPREGGRGQQEHSLRAFSWSVPPWKASIAEVHGNLITPVRVPCPRRPRLERTLVPKRLPATLSFIVTCGGD